ncbi:hypothetical protein N825_29130 [Skermanella stibiiresistens SB22]|uniref:Uncharacterized protein n=1 Tax=Skermanella stibiiresistens SB22 TaxID=1385369 RepID=W9GXR3_9PROT|nr:hypothetical protein [Skermanella stibiiresistens]EWY36263.1 hypothetical protein N825_29130 [Skermanella stibiiresistens SB22]
MAQREAHRFDTARDADAFDLQHPVYGDGEGGDRASLRRTKVPSDHACGT